MGREGGDGDRARPDDRRGARDGAGARLRRERHVERRAVDAPAQPRRHRHLRAGLDLQARHGHRRRSREGLVTPDTRFTLPYRSSTARRPHRSTTPSRADRDADGRADPRRTRPTSARSRSPRSSARRRLARWIDRFGFGKHDRHRLPRREPGLRAAARPVVGLDDRQRADRPGDRGDADPDGVGVRGGRERRRLDPAAPRRARRRPSARALDAAADHVAGRRPARSRRCSPTSSASRRDRAARPRSPATRSPARPARRRSRRPRRLLDDRVHRVVRRHGAGLGAAPRRAREGRRAARLDLRRRRRRAGVRRDREVRPAVPRGAAGCARERRPHVALRHRRSARAPVVARAIDTGWPSAPVERSTEGGVGSPAIAPGRLGSDGPGALHRGARARLRGRHGGCERGPDRHPRPRLRHARGAARHALLLRAAAHTADGHAFAATAAAARRRRARRRAAARRRPAPARRRERARRDADGRGALLRRRRPTSSTSPRSPARTARRRPRSCCTRSSRRPGGSRAC